MSQRSGLVRSSEVSPIRAIVRLLGSRMARRVGGRPDPTSPEPDSLETESLTVGPARIRRYLQATAGENVAEFAALSSLPPSFAAIWETGLFIELIRRRGYPLPRGGFLLQGCERTYLRKAALPDSFRLSVRGRSESPTRTGIRLQLESVLSDSGGIECSSSITDLLMRYRPQEARSGQMGADTEDDFAGDWREVSRLRFGAGAGRRYGFVSGDLNPIHLSRATARLFGFSRPILHGACIEATILHTLIRDVLSEDASVLCRSTIRFTAPLPLPTDAVLWAADGNGARRFRLASGGMDGGVFARGEIFTRAVSNS